jgi:hypothetical protein
MIIMLRFQQTYGYIETSYTVTYEKINWWELTKDLVDYAYDVSDGDLDFIHTIECENGMWEPLRQSNVVKEWKRETSYGLCQRNTRWFSNIVNDPNFSDPYWQIDTCWEMYNNRKEIWILHNRLYGYNNRRRCAQKFETVLDIHYQLKTKHGWFRKDGSSTRNMVTDTRMWLSEA